MQMKKRLRSPRSKAPPRQPLSVPQVLRNSIEWLSVDKLRPFEKNARTHSPRQIAQIAASIRAFGFVNPVLVDEAGTILAGHARVTAATSIGMQVVPTVRLA